MLPHKEFGVVGLGKMGGNIARNATRAGWKVWGYNRTAEVADAFTAEGISSYSDLEQLVAALPKPRILWIMVPAGKPVDDILFGDGGKGLVDLLEPGDIVIDAGNSNYKDTIAREPKVLSHNLRFMDIGVSGGPGGALNGACLMIGGDAGMYEDLKPLFADLSKNNSFQFFPGSGAGHFVKMVHNGIEYGMMQAIAEGMEVLKKSPFNLNLEDVVSIYNNGSVIESRLVGWLQDGYKKYGQDLADITSTVAHTGEGAWTVDAAKELEVPVPIIEGSLDFRKQSAENPSYTGKVLSTLRNMFGGHAAGK